LFSSDDLKRPLANPLRKSPLTSGEDTAQVAPGIGKIDFEWSKKILRRVQIQASTSGEVILELQKEIKSYRVGKKTKQKAIEPLLLEAGKTYILDRFEK
jgi:hypothetical protein